MRSTRRIRRLLIAAAVLGSSSQLFGQALVTWNNSAGGTFNVASNWIPATVPGTLDTAVFPSSGISYTLLFNNSPTNANLNFTGGTFSAGCVGATRTYTITNNFTVTGGSCGWGFGAIPNVTVNVGNDITINGGRVFVDGGGDFTCDQLAIGTTASVGTMIFQQSGTTFVSTSTGNSNLGLNGGTGSLTFDLGSAGTFSGNLLLAQSGVANSKGFINVAGGSSLNVAGNVSVGAGGVAGQTANISVAGAGSAFRMTGPGNLTVGGNSISSGSISIGAGATFASGTGTMLVNATGQVVNNGGTFIVNGSGTFTGQGAIGVAATYDGGAAGSNFILAANSSLVFQTDAAGTFSVLNVSNPGSSMTFNGTLTNLTVNTTTNVGAVGGTASLTLNNPTGAVLTGDLNIGDSPGENGVVTVTGGSNVSLGDDLDIGISASANTRGTLNIGGSVATTVFINANNTVAVGASSLSQGTINLTGGRLTTGLNGLVTVNPTGTVNVNGGTLNLQGPMTVNGGVFNKTTASILNLTTNQSISVTNGGSCTIDGGIDTPAGFSVNVSGANSAVAMSTGSIQVSSGSTLSVSTGGDVIAGTLRVGTTSGGSGVATFDGAGTTLQTFFTGSFLQIGQSGQQGTVTFSNSAQGTIAAGIGLADSGTVDSAGTLNILTNADVTCASEIRIGSGLGTGQLGRLNISGLGSSLTQVASGNVTVGATVRSVGSVTIGSGGTLTAANAMLINNTGKVDVFGTLNVNSNCDVAGILTIGNTSATAGRVNVTGHFDPVFASDGTVQFNQGTLTAQSILHSENIFFSVPDGRQATLNCNGGFFEVLTPSYILDGTTISTGVVRLRLQNGGTTSITDTFFVGGLLHNNAELRIESGAVMTADSFVGIVDTFGDGKFANTVVDGANSKLIVHNLGVNDSSDIGLGTLTIQNGGLVEITSGGQLTLFPDTDVVNLKVGGTLQVDSGVTVVADSALINLSGGTLSLANSQQMFDYLQFGGQVLFNSGTLRFRSSTDVTTDIIDRTLGAERTLSFGKGLQIDGTATFSGAMILDGGTLSVNSLAVASQVQLKSGQLNINSGSLTIGGTGQFGAALTLGGGMVVDTVGGTVVQSGGLLRINGGKLDSGGSINVASGGEIELLGSTSELAGGTLNNGGLVSGSGRINNRLTNLNTGVVRAATGQFTRFVGTAQNINSGTIQLLGGIIEFNGPLTNNSNGTISGQGNLIANAGITNSGTMLLSGGEANITGNVTNNSTARITVTGGSNSTFYNQVNNNAGSIFKVSEASIVTFLGPVTGLTSFTGPGTKIFESTAILGPLDSAGGSVVEADGFLNPTHVREASLDIFGNVAIVPNGTPTGTSVVQSLTFAGATDAWSGKLDLTDNDLIIDYTGTSPITTVKNQIKSGITSGAGILSSLADSIHALGYADNASRGLTSFSGQPIDASSVLVKYTFAGDANLDGQVDVTDLGALATTWQTPSDWSGGDFNYDGFVDVTDLGKLATNWQAGVGSPLGPSLSDALAAVGLGGVSVPEPAAAVMVFLTTSFLCLNRSRR